MEHTRFTLGISALLAEPDNPKPGGWCRDELLWAPIDQASTTNDYEVREVLSADLPMASGSDDDVGDLVVMVRPGVGGPMRPDVAAHLLRLWQRTPKDATVALTPAALGLEGPSLLVPDPYTPTVIADDGKSYPLAGVRLVPVRAVKRVLLSWGDVGGGGEVEAALAMLRLCAVHRFVLAAVPISS